MISVCRSQQLPIHILGSGSNLLVREAGVQGVVIRVVEPLLGEIRIEGTSLTAGGGALLSHVVAEAVRAGLGGIEYLVGIPGTIAGAVVGNSGGRTGDIGQLITSIRVLSLDNKIAERRGDELSFSYRRSSIQDLLRAVCHSGTHTRRF